MKKDLTELKKITFKLINEEKMQDISTEIFSDVNNNISLITQEKQQNETLEINETFSLIDQEKNLITKALKKHNGKRKLAAKDLGISERTLYRKIKEFNL